MKIRNEKYFRCVANGQVEWWRSDHAGVEIEEMEEGWRGDLNAGKER